MTDGGFVMVMENNPKKQTNYNWPFNHVNHGEKAPVVGNLILTCGKLSATISNRIGYQIGKSHQHLIAQENGLGVVIAHINQESNLLPEHLSHMTTGKYFEFVMTYKLDNIVTSLELT